MQLLQKRPRRWQKAILFPSPRCEIKQIVLTVSCSLWLNGSLSNGLTLISMKWRNQYWSIRPNISFNCKINWLHCSRYETVNVRKFISSKILSHRGQFIGWKLWTGRGGKTVRSLRESYLCCPSFFPVSIFDTTRCISRTCSAHCYTFYLSVDKPSPTNHVVLTTKCKQRFEID